MIMIGRIFAFATLVVAGILYVALVAPAGGSKPPPSSPTVLLTVMGGNGSGVILPGGYILTAAHVARVSPDDIMVTADNGDSTTLVDVLWMSHEYDIALLKVRDAKFLKGAGTADIACRTAEIGEDIRAEGNPFAVRFVSQWGKIGSKVQSIGHWRHAFSIGAPLAPGMSGGPVYDAEGRVVGINVGISPVGGFYIAVPSSTACMLMGR